MEITKKLLHPQRKKHLASGAWTCRNGWLEMIRSEYIPGEMEQRISPGISR